LRKNIDAAEYKHVVLGLIFLKYISDSFEALHQRLEGEISQGADPEDIEEYEAENVFFVPTEARWEYLVSKAKDPLIGKYVDDAMDAIEKDNSTLKGVLPKVFARQNLDPTSLGELIDLIGNSTLSATSTNSADLLGHVFEYFLGEFALAEGKKGGQFYTPRSVVELLVNMLEPYKGRVLDPCCGSGGMFVQSEKFVKEHQGLIDDISIYGQESNQTTWRLCKMNLAIRGIDASQVKWNNEGSFLNDAHQDLKVDYIIANPPFNDSDWSGDQLRSDARWQYGVPPAGNANFAWIQHFIYHLAPTGTACYVSTNEFRNRKDEILFIDARNLGHLINRRTRELSMDDIHLVANTYHNWRSVDGKYEDEAGFCASVPVSRVAELDYVLTPGRYVGLPEEEDDFDFAERFTKLKAEFEEQLKEEARLNELIKENLSKIDLSK
jgi:type I restriction enzyme M protein